ncbi:hypothetical protein [Hymenobacter canadensis]|uniref:ASCH domain-containing protein n=1 Tax=Hymenobacter canadensis TaxID=2999067 RepID=A0ABY7LRP2_9BACT|nr:hypothetical protein [Hymenobacter canadensis]WBA43085.1 hypothetical protein O3303_05840 [Hymenobacter canadensis]
MDSISFNPAMLAAVLAGHKTVTRRRLSPLLPVQQEPGRYCFRRLTGSGAWFEDRQEPGQMLPPVPCPFGPAGAVLRVQEAPDCLLRVVGIRVEQVGSITEAQARLEGVRARRQRGRVQWGGVAPDAQAVDGLQWHDSAVGAFQELFESIYPAAWARNEWVWVLEFERLS